MKNTGPADRSLKSRLTGKQRNSWTTDWNKVPFKKLYGKEKTPSWKEKIRELRNKNEFVVLEQNNSTAIKLKEFFGARSEDIVSVSTPQKVLLPEIDHPTLKNRRVKDFKNERFLVHAKAVFIEIRNPAMEGPRYFQFTEIMDLKLFNELSNETTPKKIKNH